MDIGAIKSLAASGEVEARRKAALSLSGEPPGEVLPVLAGLLGDNNWRVRKAAVESAIVLPCDKSVPVLISALFDPDNAGLRNSAVEALTKIGTPVLPYLYETVIEEDPDVKLAIINLFGEIPSKGSTPHLIYFLSHTNKNFVSAAVGSLGKLKDPANLPILLDMTDRADEWVLFHLIDALAEIGGSQAIEKLMDLYSNPRLQKAIIRAFGKMGDLSVIPYLFESAEVNDTPVLELMATIGRLYYAPLPALFLENHRAEMGRLIRKAYPLELCEKLTQLWGDAKVPEKRGIVIVSGFVTDMTLQPNLFDELLNPYLQRDVLWAISQYGALAFSNILRRLSQTQSEEEKVRLLELLAETQSPEAVAPILGYARDDSDVVRREALSGLAKVDDIRSINELLSVLQEEDETHHETALRSIKILMRRRQEYKNKAFEKARAFMQSENSNLRRAGFLILGEDRERTSAELLSGGLQDPTAEVRQVCVQLIAQISGKNSIQKLLSLFSDESPKVRKAVINSLGRDLLENHSDVLIVALQDPDVWVRAEAAFFLAQSTDPSIPRALLDLLEKDHLPAKLSALRGLSEVGCGTLFDEVIRISNEDPSLEVRRTALHALAKSGRQEGKSALISALADPCWEIRSAAIEWMAESGDRGFVAPLLRELERDSDNFVRQTIIQALTKLKALEAVPRLLHYLTHPDLKDSVSEYFLSLEREHVPLVEHEAQSVDFQTKLVLIEILKHLENK
ncbi:MAG TPA: HEAT repeat domain-containing protein [Acidobacteriota bacterium]|jgi:HEAT repeat protein|nr:HEAT repeat domain-containing protein [Acidobacteriota bacterium]HNT17310.1 HEAT repeat domain-containing protein [Acidobacteriota bacterium]